jgi:hypothetical protein
LRKISKTIQQIETYKSNTATEPIANLSLKLPSIPLDRELSLVKLSLNILKDENRALNLKFNMNKTHASIKMRGAIPMVSAAEIRHAFLSTVLHLNTVNQQLKSLALRLVERLREIKLTHNHLIPPSVLSGIDIELANLNLPRTEVVKLKKCKNSSFSIICTLEVGNAGSPIRLNPIIPVPYLSSIGALFVSFPPNLLYQENTGRTLDTSHCRRIHEQFSCPSISLLPNDCLEQIHFPSKGIPETCTITKWLHTTPLISKVKIGYLVAQTSHSPMTVLHGDTAIIQDPVLISNNLSLQINYGSHSTQIAPLSKPLGEIHFPIGNITEMIKLYRSQFWYQSWKDWIPEDSQQILLLISLSVQGLTVSSALALLILAAIKYKKGDLSSLFPLSKQKIGNDIELDHLNTSSLPASSFPSPSFSDASHRQSQISKALLEY